MKENARNSITIVILGVLIFGTASLYLVNEFTKDKNQNLNNDLNLTENEKTREISVDDFYKKFVKKHLEYREDYTQVISFISEDDYQPWIKRAEIDERGDLIVSINNETLKEKYGREYKLLSNVLKFDILEHANGGYKWLVAIMEDGSISVISQVDTMNHNTFKVKNYPEFKNIVDVINVGLGEGPGIMVVLAIDIEGNSRAISYEYDHDYEINLKN
ncbi:MAG TPA: hypothetical protein GXZ63_01960 [Mollicutes bacterium]|nr:hypothetical protein [Mollicutes bacterium]